MCSGGETQVRRELRLPRESPPQEGPRSGQLPRVDGEVGDRRSESVPAVTWEELITQHSPQ